MRHLIPILALASFFAGTTGTAAQRCIKESDHVRARDLGIAPGVLAPGPLDAISPVRARWLQYRVSGNTIHTGATAIVPHGGNLYQSKVPAGLVPRMHHYRIAT